MSKPKITDEQLRSELAAGVPIQNIAEKYNMTARGVRGHLAKLYKKEQREPLCSEQIWKELLEGSSRQELADKYDVTEMTIYNHIRKMGGLQKLKKELEAMEDKKKSYGQQQTEKLREQASVNPNNALQEMLTREKTKIRKLSQKLEELERENVNLRSAQDRWIPTAVEIPPEPKENKQQEYIVQIRGASLSTTLIYQGIGEWVDYDGNYYNVAAWQPMPEAYRPEDPYEIPTYMGE